MVVIYIYIYSTSRNRNSPFSTRFPHWTVPKRAARHFGCHPVVALRRRRRSSRVALDAGSTTHGGSRVDPIRASTCSSDIDMTHWWLQTPRRIRSRKSEKRSRSHVFWFSRPIVGVFNHEFWCFSVHILMCESSILYYCFSFTVFFNVLSMVVL